MHNTKLAYHEPIYSVQQQSYFRVEQINRSICRSDHTDECYRDYLVNNLTLGFGQLREVEYEKLEYSKPSLVILSPSLDIEESEITRLTEILISFLEELRQYRKRYAIVHADENSYIIGGYIFDAVNKLRALPEHDFKFDRKTAKPAPMVSLPMITVSFGLAIGQCLEYEMGETCFAEHL